MNALTEVAPTQLSRADIDGGPAILRAELGYICDPDQRSLEHWWRECASRVLGFSTLRRQAHRGRWVERRAEFWRQVSGRVLRERAGELAAAQTRELADLEGARQTLLGELTTAKPRSLEGVVAALVALDKRAEEKRGSILARLDRVAPASVVAQKGSTFDPDELRVMARAVLQLRLQRQQEGVGASCEAQDSIATITR